MTSSLTFLTLAHAMLAATIVAPVSASMKAAYLSIIKNTIIVKIHKGSANLFLR